MQPEGDGGLDQSDIEIQETITQIREQTQAHLDQGAGPDLLSFAMVFVATEMSLQFAPNDLVAFQNASSAQLEAIELIAELRSKQSTQSTSINNENDSEAVPDQEKSSAGHVLH